MMSLKVWGTGLVVTTALVAAAGCGETSNFVGDMPEAGSGGNTAQGGTSNGGSVAHGGSSQAGSTALGGTGDGGTQTIGGTGSGGSEPVGGTGSGGSTTQGGTGSGGSAPGECGELSGNWTSCQSGLVHRSAPGKCDSKLPHAATLPPVDAQLDQCTKDSDCTAKPNGFCAVFYPGFSDVKAHNACNYGCTQDADCSEGQVCQCGTEIGECASARECKSDQDCQGSLCAVFDACPGVPTYDFACQKPNDECLTDADCRAKDAGKQFCTLGVSGHRECQGVVCAI